MVQAWQSLQECALLFLEDVNCHSLTKLACYTDNNLQASEAASQPAQPIAAASAAAAASAPPAEAAAALPPAAAEQEPELLDSSATAAVWSLIWAPHTNADDKRRWNSQGFTLCTDEDEVSFGLAQGEGGPCGVLAAVQVS
jgi:Domain of unknown function (DUF4205)